MSSKKSPKNSQDTPLAQLDKMEIVLETAIMKCKPFVIPVLVIIGIFILVVGIFTYVTNKKKDTIGSAYKDLEYALAIDIRDSGQTEIKDEKVTEKRKKYKDLIANYPNTSAAIDAEFYLAKLDFSMGNYEKAGKGFSEFHSKFIDYQPMATLALVSEASSIFASGQIKESKIKLEAISKDPEIMENYPHIISEVNFKRALCELLTSQYDEAKALLNGLLASESNEFIKNKAQSFLAKMEILSPEEIKNSILMEKTAKESGEEEAVDVLTDERTDAIEKVEGKVESNTIVRDLADPSGENDKQVKDEKSEIEADQVQE